MDFKFPEMYGTIKETNELFRDFGIRERVNKEEWVNKSPIALENYRKKVIRDFLDGVVERNF